MRTVFYSFLFALFAHFAMAQQNLPSIRYDVSFPELQNHYVDVSMQLDGLTGVYTDLKIPTWAPGSYLIREFAKNIEQFRVEDDKNNRLKFEKIDKNTWRIFNASATKIVIRYKVYAFEVSVRNSFVDESHAFLSPTGIFLFPENGLNASSAVNISLPENWSKISTGLEKGEEENSFIAPDFDTLYDCPIEIGNQDIFHFKAAGVDHEVAMYGGGNYKIERLKKDMALIVEELTKVFGENPNKRYVFIIHNYHNAAGGLEHANSTVLGMSRMAYGTEKTYQDFLSLVAHEYFHLWNVKRLRPFALGPFNYDQENYTTALWIAEGFTSYYDNHILARTKHISKEKYFEILAADLSTYENQPGNQYQSLSEASFDTWIKYYRPNENSKNSTISYYQKGALIASLFDLAIIKATDGERDLDQVMKAAYQKFYKTKHTGFSDNEFQDLLQDTLKQDLSDFYKKYVNGVDSLPFKTYLGYVGLTLTDENALLNNPWLGINISKDGKNRITYIQRNSPAWQAGLSVNDELIAINDYRVDNNLEDMILANKIGDKITVLVARDNMLKNIPVTLARNPAVKYKISLNPQANGLQQKCLQQWLKNDEIIVNSDPKKQ